jgi:predicted N-formylglutamate amidohydrolase
LPHCAIEIRQDLVGTPDGTIYWAKIISKLLEEILLMEQFQKKEY